MSKQDPPTPSLVVENPDQAAHIRAWWVTIAEAIAAAGGINQALSLKNPGGYYEDLLFRLLDLDWERFPEAVRKDGRPFRIREVDGVGSGIFRDHLSKWADAVKLSASGQQSEQSPGAVGRNRRPESEEPREVQQGRVVSHEELMGQLQALGGALNALPDQVTVRAVVRPGAQNVVPPRFRRPRQQPSAGGRRPLGEERKRAAIPRSVKLEVWQRDGGRCRNCGITDDECMKRTGEHLQYDHIWPWSMNGADTARNIQLLCGACNRAKSSRYL